MRPPSCCSPRLAPSASAAYQSLVENTSNAPSAPVCTMVVKSRINAIQGLVAAEHPAVFLQTVTENAHAAMLARRRQALRRAFEAVERVRFSGCDDLKGLVVVVAAHFTSCHDGLLRSKGEE